ncbi:MAG: hypothetical protein CMI16_02860 [Opitutaceae bacterium]|nr:hypothetical protein [Opitutaceae bacterium]
MASPVLIEADTLLLRKRETLTARQHEVLLVERRVSQMSETGEIAPRGCGICSFIFSRRSGENVSALRNATAAAKLNQTGDAVRARVQTLQTRLDSMRAQAKVLYEEHRKVDAIAMLRRSKAIEKQLNVAQTTADALDVQILMLEEASLQREVSAALGASVKAVKKKTKTLLKDTENAVDGAADVRDLNEDLQGAFEGLRPVADTDEDDLLAELDELITSTTAVSESASVDTTVPYKHEIVTSVAAYPETPMDRVKVENMGVKREERAQLLATG